MANAHVSNWLGSFRNRLAVVFGGASLLLGFMLISYIEVKASERLTAAMEQYLQVLTRSIAHAMQDNLVEREREVALLSQSPLFTNPNASYSDLRRVLQQVGDSYEHYSWIGLTDVDGHVRVAKDGLLEGASVAARPWFIEGINGAFIGDVHKALLLAKLLSPDAEEGNAAVTEEPLRFIDFASPVFSNNGDLLGVIATHTNWDWTKKLIRSALPEDAKLRGIEAFIVNAKGDLLYPFEQLNRITMPTGWQQKAKHSIFQWSDGADYLTSTVRIDASVSTDLGWYVVLRQPVGIALETVDELQRQFYLLTIFASILFMALAYKLAAEFSRPIEKLAKSAREVHYEGSDPDFLIASDMVEIRTLADSIDVMKESLLERSRKLRNINATLEEKVADRTKELEAANHRLAHLATHDTLTGLYNRRALDQALQTEFSRMKRTQQVYSVAVVDIDHFKQVNDSYGHDVGDEVLTFFAELLGHHARKTDLLARSGGEEFMLVLPDTLLEGAQILAEKIRYAIVQSDIPTVGTVTASIGVSEARLDDESDAVIVKRADKALYQAKASGRNRVCSAPK